MRIRPRGRADDGRAFFKDFNDGRISVSDDLAEGLAEEFLQSAISGQEQGGDAHDLIVDEESGGPFVITSKRQEFARNEPGYEGGDSEAFPTPGPSPARQRRTGETDHGYDEEEEE